MSSRVFKAKTSHTESKPQLCGLTGNHIQQDDLCFFLVCKGGDARPEYQIMVVDEVEYQDAKGRTRKRKVRACKDPNDDREFYCVWNGEWEVYEDAYGKKKRRRVYEWEVDGQNGAKHPVEVWSNMVHVSAAESLGYDIPKTGKGKYQMTTAFKGDRTKGNEHRVAKDAESPLLTLAKAAQTDEEAGLVKPDGEAAA